MRSFASILVLVTICNATGLAHYPVRVRHDPAMSTKLYQVLHIKHPEDKNKGEQVFTVKRTSAYTWLVVNGKMEVKEITTRAGSASKEPKAGVEYDKMKTPTSVFKDKAVAAVEAFEKNEEKKRLEAEASRSAASAEPVHTGKRSLEDTADAAADVEQAAGSQKIAKRNVEQAAKPQESAEADVEQAAKPQESAEADVKQAAKSQNKNNGSAAFEVSGDVYSVGDSVSVTTTEPQTDSDKDKGGDEARRQRSLAPSRSPGPKRSPRSKRTKTEPTAVAEPTAGGDSQPLLQPDNSNSQPVLQPDNSDSQPVLQPANSDSQPVLQPGDTDSQPVLQPGDTDSQPKRGRWPRTVLCRGTAFCSEEDSDDAMLSRMPNASQCDEDGTPQNTAGCNDRNDADVRKVTGANVETQIDSESEKDDRDHRQVLQILETGTQIGRNTDRQTDRQTDQHSAARHGTV